MNDKFWLFYLITLILWSAALLARIMYNGLIFGFDYGLFHPDGALYTYRTLRWSGFGDIEAGGMIADWYQNHSFKAQYSSNSFTYPNYASQWEQYSTRLLYPFLSIPFVKLFGVAGMIIVPALTYLFVLLVACWTSLRMRLPWLGIAVISLVVSSTSISRWMFANITDGLLLLFTSILTVVIVRRTSLELSRVDWCILTALIVGSAVTRFSGFMWMAIALIFLFHRKILPAAWISFVTIVAHIPIFMRPFVGQVLPGFNDRTLFEKILIYPTNLAKVTFFEVGQLWVLDRTLFFVLVIAICMSIAFFNRLSSKFFLATLASLYLTGSINGVLGVNFRYQLPIVPFVIWVLIDLTPLILMWLGKN